MKELTIYVAFLRGINVGGRNNITMTDLKACFEELGYSDVRTYINSGNIVFKAASNPRALESAIEKALDQRLSLPVRAIVRTVDEIKQTIQAFPESWQTEGELKCDVIFLGRSIDTPKILEKVDFRPEIEALVYEPGVLFWSIGSKDFGKSRFVKVNQMDIYQDMTVRSPGTVRKIYDLMRA